eukprot:scaffold37046_cov320-Isochrysis_galbana.AAC.1
MGALVILAGAWRRLAVAATALLARGVGRFFEEWERLAARLAAGRGGSRVPSSSAKLGVPVAAGE